jgi:hypothetical protein
MNERNAREVYADIIDLPHHKSTRHPHMSLYNRAAQFAPFAALTGYDAMVREEARLTQQRPEPSEEEQAELNRTLNLLRDLVAQGKAPLVRAEHFVPDQYKKGGSVEIVQGRLKRVDTVRRRLVFYAENGVSQGRHLALEDVCGLRALDGENAD